MLPITKKSHGLPALSLCVSIMLPITTKVMVYPLCLSVCQYNVTDHNKSHGLPALSL